MALFKFTPQQRVYYGGILLFVGIILMFVLPSELFVEGGLFIAGSILLWAFLFNLQYGLYALVTFSFFSNWFIYLGSYSWSKNLAYLSSVNAPLVDFVVLLLGIGLGLAWLLEIYIFKWEYVEHLKKLIILYALFVAWAGMSALKAFDNNTQASLYYLVRSIIFVFAAYVIVPNLLIRTKELLQRVITIWFWVGVVIALFGLSSFLVVPQSGWWRVTPYGIGSIAPLGYNHNLIAEVLIAIIPLGIYLVFKAQKNHHQDQAMIYGIGTALMLAAELLTLSRAGWICVTIEMIVGGWLLLPHLKSFLAHKGIYLLYAAAVVGMTLSVYMVFFLKSSIVSSSTKARFTTSEITLFYLQRSPVLGHGPGMYVPLFSSVQDYVEEFGDALDAHGLMQKMALEEGVVGLVIFLMVLIYILGLVYSTYRGVRHDQELLALLLTMLVGTIGFQFFNTSYFSSVMWLPIGVALSAVGLYRKEVI
jgi:O-antigen ligase